LRPAAAWSTATARPSPPRNSNRAGVTAAYRRCGTVALFRGFPQRTAGDPRWFPSHLEHCPTVASRDQTRALASGSTIRTSAGSCAGVGSELRSGLTRPVVTSIKPESAQTKRSTSAMSSRPWFHRRLMRPLSPMMRRTRIQLPPRRPAAAGDVATALDVAQAARRTTRPSPLLHPNKPPQASSGRRTGEQSRAG